MRTASRSHRRSRTTCCRAGPRYRPCASSMHALRPTPPSASRGWVKAAPSSAGRHFQCSQRRHPLGVELTETPLTRGDCGGDRARRGGAEAEASRMAAARLPAAGQSRPSPAIIGRAPRRGEAPRRRPIARSDAQSAARAPLIDVHRLAALARIEYLGAAWRIGPSRTHASRMRAASSPGARCSAIAFGIAYRSVRNRGTIGGSLAHADPAADWPLRSPPLARPSIFDAPAAPRPAPRTARRLHHGACGHEIIEVESMRPSSPRPGACGYKFCPQDR